MIARPFTIKPLMQVPRVAEIWNSSMLDLDNEKLQNAHRKDIKE
jgi:hypothetical protein